jgi:trigger factor
METKVISRTETEVKFTVTVSESELKSTFKHVLDDLRPQVKAAGFRPGKAPDNIVERELGANRLQSEVIDHALQSSYSKAIRQENIPVVSPPQVTIDKFVPYTELEYTVTVDIIPPVKLADYRKFRIKKTELKIEAADVDKVVEDLRRREAVRLESEQPAKTGDEVNFDFDGTKKGQPVNGASAKGQTLVLGSGQFIPGFEEQMVGMKVGEEKTFDIRFPKDYHEKTLANEVVTFAIKINKVTDLVLPALDHEFVAKVSPFKSVEDLKSDVLLQLGDRQHQEAARAQEKEILDRLLAESKYSAPESLVRQQLDRMRGELEQNLSYSGLDLTRYLEMTQKTNEQLDTELRPEAEKRVGLALILTAVGDNEKVEVTASELDAEITNMKKRYEDKLAQAELDTPETREEIYNQMMGSRVMAKLVEYAEN